MILLIVLTILILVLAKIQILIYKSKRNEENEKRFTPPFPFQVKSWRESHRFYIIPLLYIFILPASILLASSSELSVWNVSSSDIDAHLVHLVMLMDSELAVGDTCRHM